MNERGAMTDFLRQLRDAHGINERLLLVQEKQAQLRRFDPEKGDTRALHLAEQLRIAGLTQVEERAHRMNAAERQEMERRAREGKDYLSTTVRVTQAFDKTLEALKAMAVFGGPFLDAWKALGNIMQGVRSMADSALSGLRQMSAFLDAHPYLKWAIMRVIPGGNIADAIKGMGKGFGAPEGGHSEAEPGQTFKQRFDPYGAATILAPKGGGANANTPQHFVDAFGTGPYSPKTGGLDDFLPDSPMSSNIEDRRNGEKLDENTSGIDANTAELKRLNDFLQLDNKPLGFMSTQMGGLRAGLGGGIGSGYGGMGRAGGSYGGRGRGGGGSNSGGRDDGTGASDTGATGELGTPSGTNALYSPSGSGKSLADLKWADGSPVTASKSTADQYAWPGSPIKNAEGQGGGGAAWLASQRASRIAEINANPALKAEVLGMLRQESGGSTKGMTATFEALLNRSAMVGNTIQSELHSGFYSTVQSGAARAAGGLGGAAEDAFNAGAGGSNLIKSRTDQGMVGDPNWQGPGQVPDPSGGKEVYNFWKGQRGGRDYTHEDARKFAEKQERGYAGAGVDSAYKPGRGAMQPSGPFTVPFRTENNKDVEKYVGFERAVNNMDPEFKARLQAAYNDMPEDVKKSFVINEGWRSYEQQAEYRRRYEAGTGPIAARPGHGEHEVGKATDVDAGPAREWLRRNQTKYGLRDLSGDAPHFRLDPRDKRRFHNPDSNPTSDTKTRANGAVPYQENPFGRGMPVASRGDDDDGRELDTAAGKNFGKGGRELDRAAGKGVRVHGTGRVEVDFKNMPDGVSGKAQGEGLFKDTAVTTQKQMAPASKGSSASANMEQE